MSMRVCTFSTWRLMMVPTPWRRVMKPSRSREARMSRSCVRLMPSRSDKTLSRGRRSLEAYSPLFMEASSWARIVLDCVS